jgi:uncharacterized membrane protein
MWLIFALISPFFWAIVHVMDSHCVEEVLEKPWVGMVTSALSSIIVFLPLPILLLFFSWEIPETNIVIFAIAAGVLIQISQAFYFKSLSYSEAGIIAAYWNMTPAFLPIVSYFFLSRVLEIPQYMGIILLVISSVVLCLLDTEFHTRWKAFWLMFIASTLQVAALMLEDHIFDNASYFVGFYLIATGLILTGISPLIFARARRRVFSNFPRLRKAMKIFLGIEVANLLALASSERAISLGNPSLVAAVETTVPAYTFLLSLILLGFGSKLGDPSTKNSLLYKFFLVLVMGAGVWFVS